MITINGKRINKVTSIKCDSETGFLTQIRFHCDERITGCTPLSDLKDFEPVVVSEPSPEDVGEAIIVLPQKREIHFKDNAR